MITKLDEKNFTTETQSGLKLIEFSTPWCGFCKKQEPVLEEMDKVWIGQVNGDDSPALVEKYGISGYPSFVVLKDGKEVDRFVGLHTKFDIMNILLKYLA
ncbi:MAG: thioredoxin family protein [Candidatus Gastranaerophilales bacterium]|nr:thioredoxin family protein [Candidatus Gastranaerophilales bacterium]